MFKQSYLLGFASILLFLPDLAMASIAGKTILAKGDVKAINSDTLDVRGLRRRAKIFSVDSIATGTDSKAQFSMSDGGLITLKPNTELKISEYRFDKETKEGAATIEVVKGGLRSISGLIKKSGGDYHVKTPVGSIGIRGTHFAVEVVDDKVFFGVFSGNIDIKLHNEQTLSLGANENFAFASVAADGNVTLMTTAPPSIAKDLPKGPSLEQNETKTTSDTTSPQTSNKNYKVASAENTFDASSYNESTLLDVSNSSIADLISERTGTLTYQNFGNDNVTSSQGAVSDFNISMVVDFDKGTIPEGSLNFTDPQGEWFAVYSGLINQEQLNLGINFASHNNNRADGNISAAFSNGLDEITGAFELFEKEDKTINASGSFKIKP